VSAPTRERPGGRSERIRRQVAQACLDLLAEGKADFGPLDVMRRSGVSRVTIHRWWPTKADLVTEALTLHTSRLQDMPDTGTWEGDVRALVLQLAAFFSDPIEVTQNAIMASGNHSDYDEVVVRYYQPVFAGWRRLVERARERGEVRDDVDADTVILLMTSPLVSVPLVMHRTLTRREIRHIADLIIAATAA
jgi:AcrR family transcriptional regulator